METLTTTYEVIDALGGYLAVADITGSKPKAVSNWPRFKTFPSNTYLALTEALHERGKTAPPSLWGMKAPAEADSAA